MEVGLVLKRRVGERILLITPAGEHIYVTQLEGAKLGIKAPEDVQILRAEKAAERGVIS